MSMASNFTHAIVRRPCRRVIEGITTNPQLGTPDYELTQRQHILHLKTGGSFSRAAP